jgi:hypothetical protein
LIYSNETREAFVSSPWIIDDVELHSYLSYWLERYPNERPWVDSAARQLLRQSEASWLAPYAGVRTLDKHMVSELIDWKWSNYAGKRIPAHNGIAGAKWAEAKRSIETALSATTATEAMDALVEPPKGGAGIEGWKTPLSSALLTACRPDRYPLADSQAFKSIKRLNGTSDHHIAATVQFPRRRWESYVKECRDLSARVGCTLRELDQALWASSGRKHPGWRS